MGKYFKMFNGSDSKDTILTYIEDGKEEDYNYTIRNELKTIGQQTVETREEMGQFFEMGFWLNSGNVKTINRRFNNIAFVSYFYGKIDGIYMIRFDFENNTVTIKDKKYKINANTKNDFRVLKDKINCIGGIEEMYNLLINALRSDNYLHRGFAGIFKTLYS